MVGQLRASDLVQECRLLPANATSSSRDWRTREEVMNKMLKKS